MPDTAEVAALGLDALAELQALAEQHDALWTPEIPHDDPRYNDRYDERRGAEIDLIERAMTIWAEATGRCAEHLTLGIAYGLAECTWRCRNRAKTGPQCGRHAQSWEHRRDMTRARVESNRKLRIAEDVAGHLRAHGVEVTGWGTEHLSIPLDTARELVAHLARVGDLA